MARSSGDQRSHDARNDSTDTATGSAARMVAAFAATLTVVVAAFGLTGERGAHADVPVGAYFELTCYDSGSTFTEFVPVVYWDATPNPVTVGGTTTEQVRVDIPTLASNSHHLTWRFTIPSDEQFVGVPTVTDLGDVAAGGATATIIGSDTLEIVVVGPFEANQVDVEGPTVQFQVSGTDGAGNYPGYHLRAADDGYAFTYTRTDGVFQIGVNCDADHWTWIGPFRAAAPTTTTSSSTTTSMSTTTSTTTAPTTTTSTTTAPTTTSTSTTTAPTTTTSTPPSTTSTTASTTTTSTSTTTSTTTAPTTTSTSTTTAPTTSTSTPPSTTSTTASTTTRPATTAGPTTSASPTADPVPPSSVAGGWTSSPSTSGAPATVDPVGVQAAPVAEPVTGTPSYTG